MPRCWKYGLSALMYTRLAVFWAKPPIANAENTTSITIKLRFIIPPFDVIALLLSTAPGSSLSFLPTQGPIEVERSADERQMCKCLGEVADGFTAWTGFFRIQ